MAEKVPARRTAEALGEEEFPTKKSATNPTEGKLNAVPRPAPIEEDEVVPTNLEENEEPVVSQVEKPAAPSAVRVSKWVASKRVTPTTSSDVNVAEVSK
jgi:hypothetical protein